jgi:hypothetical protein
MDGHLCMCTEDQGTVSLDDNNHSATALQSFLSAVLHSHVGCDLLERLRQCLCIYFNTHKEDLTGEAS